MTAADNAAADSAADNRADNAAAARAPELAAYPVVPLLDYDSAAGTAPDLPIGGGLLLVHGFGGDKTSLRPLGDRLCPQGMSAWYPSLRGHGASLSPPWGYSILDFTADLHRIADALPDEVHLVGHSYGALVAAMSAVTWGGGGRVKSLVAIDQSFDAHPERHEADEWVEGSYLRWMYGFRHLLDQLSIPVLCLFARDSPNVPAAERAELRARTTGRLTCRDISGTHADCVTRVDELAATLGDFYRAELGPEQAP